MNTTASVTGLDIAKNVFVAVGREKEIEIKECATSGDMLKALKIERDENNCRKPFTPSEMERMKKLIEDQFKKEAKDRMKEGGKKGAPGKPVERVDQQSHPLDSKTRANEAIAEPLGTSRGTLERAEKAVMHCRSG